MNLNITLPVFKFQRYALTVLNRETLEEMYRNSSWKEVLGETICDDNRIKNKDLDFRVLPEINPTSEYNGILLVGDNVTIEELQEKIKDYLKENLLKFWH